MARTSSRSPARIASRTLRFQRSWASSTRSSAGVIQRPVRPEDSPLTATTPSVRPRIPRRPHPGRRDLRHRRGLGVEVARDQGPAALPVRVQQPRRDDRAGVDGEALVERAAGLHAGGVDRVGPAVGEVGVDREVVVEVPVVVAVPVLVGPPSPQPGVALHLVPEHGEPLRREQQHGVDAGGAQAVADGACGARQLGPARGGVAGEEMGHGGDERRRRHGTHSTTALPVAITVP